MLMPLKQWICDVCGQLIEQPQNGYVIWRRDEENRSYGFKIVHQAKCDLKDYPSSAALDSLSGDDGLAILLSFLSAGPLLCSFEPTSPPRVKDLDEFVDLVRRVQTPYYEEARTHFHGPDTAEEYADANEVYPYLPRVLKRIAGESESED